MAVIGDLLNLLRICILKPVIIKQSNIVSNMASLTWSQALVRNYSKNIKYKYIFFYNNFLLISNLLYLFYYIKCIIFCMKSYFIMFLILNSVILFSILFLSYLSNLFHYYGIVPFVFCIFAFLL